jgi:hypothetical protein
MSNIFLSNKYTKWYFNIIEYAKSNPHIGYTERHHIVPKSFYSSRSETGCIEGDADTDTNLVNLTARQHYVCHLLLTKMTTGHNKSKMVYALHRTVHGNTKNLIKCSRIYESLKEQFRQIQSDKISGEGNYFYGKRFTGEQNHFYGKSHSDETKAKISKSRKGKGGRAGKDNSMYGRTGNLHPGYGKPRSDETKKKIKENQAKNLVKGKTHPRSIPVTINGILYESKNIARIQTGLSDYMINKLSNL